ncbi:MAG: hypothetical protein K2J23_01350 [Muribaculaceae bacterium]|nr:hypothetical protein [Muribaculaceae bacterium]
MKKRGLFLPLIFSLMFLLPAAIYGSEPRSAPISSGRSLAEMVRALEHDTAPSALYHLSTLYERGFDSIPADSLRAMTLLKESARRGYAPAQNYLGFKLYTTAPDSAWYWLGKAADAGDAKALSNMAYLLLSEDTLSSSPLSSERSLKAIELLQRSADSGVATAKAHLGDLYRKGRGVERDSLMARQLYLDAVRGGYADAEMPLWYIEEARLNTLSPEEALRAGKEAAEAGADAVAFLLFRRAVEGDIPEAYTLIGDAYSSAKGVDYNYEKALENYKAGAEKGDPRAQRIIEELLEIFPDIFSKER